MKHGWKAQADVDSAVCAEIPDREEESEAYEAVTTYMIHRKCGADDTHSPCMRDGRCAKRFPNSCLKACSWKLIATQTQTETHNGLD
ncbi:hypothetical protein NECAME_02894 [Necator americanus]|uniref:Uncharacterized protein n=1 Tax=Necator americanus TaxID=51031 RepID=W2TBS9_NECAM|nr:hypothetical protein NECAME_02894 [Necator americanus]ETN78457.1 hypothetical protein NECAME_02894 [Necator americanus]